MAKYLVFGIVDLHRDDYDSFLWKIYLNRIKGKTILLNKYDYYSDNINAVYSTSMFKHTCGSHVWIFPSEVRELTFVDIWELKRNDQMPSVR